MDVVNVGIVGIGNIGYTHAMAIISGEVPAMRLTAVCDTNPDKLQAFSQLHTDVATYLDYHQMLQDANIDAAIVATPHNLHGEIGIAVLQVGKHLLVEKPVDIRVSEAKKLNAAAEKSGKIFGIMLNQRTNPLFQKARELVQSGELGEMKRTVWQITNWYRTQHYYDSGDWRATWRGEGGGVLINQAPHQLDLWQWICGMPKSITAFCETAKYHNIEVEDEATILARYENGATGVFITTTGEYPGTNRLEISCEKGKVVLEDGVLKLWRLAESQQSVSDGATESFPKIPYDFMQFEFLEKQNGHLQILQNFAQAILNNEPLLAPGYDGVYELSVSNAAYLSQWLGNVSVEIPLDEAMFDKLLQERIDKSAYKITYHTTELSREYSSRWSVNW